MSEPQLPPDDAHALVGAYALDAVDDAERFAFERHLQGCAGCRAELRGLRAAASQLGAATPIAPPPELKVAVLEAASRTRQLPPGEPEPTPAERETAPRRGLSARLLAACASVVALLALGTSAGLGVALHREQTSAAQLAALLKHPERTAYASVSGGGSAVVAFAHGRAAVRIAGVPALPQAKTYELWVLPESGNPRPAGLLGGSGGSALVSDVREAKALAVTVEPAAGSRAPTSTPIVVVPV